MNKNNIEKIRIFSAVMASCWLIAIILLAIAIFMDSSGTSILAGSCLSGTLVLFVLGPILGFLAITANQETCS